MKALCLAMLFLSMSAYAQDLPLPSPGQTTLKVYSIYYANPSETAEMIKMMMPSTTGLGIQVTDRRLAVRGTVEQHTVAEQMLRELDKPPKNIQINVRRTAERPKHLLQ